ncbi:hypothetical protein DAI22_05g024000 [Oryza sativa Japonica Group]|nr:hypothetical protein DAI22_05g024000 [Oryza sativa Japonica Group]KAF2928994.1 hypothetical protein DAI22_05g024000 [Oryza sativa Japonica Group]
MDPCRDHLFSSPTGLWLEFKSVGPLANTGAEESDRRTEQITFFRMAKQKKKLQFHKLNNFGHFLYRWGSWSQFLYGCIHNKDMQ